ncbi:hypothetical protein BV902_12975 [Sphingobacterium sp. B29]|nr:hypothetical protein BV902_12975 [Sphingobacterium sp. B29]
MKFINVLSGPRRKGHFCFVAKRIKGTIINLVIYGYSTTLVEREKCQIVRQRISHLYYLFDWNLKYTKLNKNEKAP